MDTIIDVCCENSKVFITLSDNSLIQFGLDEKSISKIEEEKFLLLDAEVISFTNDAKKGFFKLCYNSRKGRARFLEFSYDPLEQEKFIQSLEAQNYQTSSTATLQQQRKKANIARIVITRDEGTIAEYGTTLVAIGWLEAEQILKQWSATISSPTRADKCRIVFEFADGESFKLSSFELMQKHRFRINLAQELLTKLQYMAGEIIPAHITQQDYENYCKFCKINPDVYKQLLNSWAIPA